MDSANSPPPYIVTGQPKATQEISSYRYTATDGAEVSAPINSYPYTAMGESQVPPAINPSPFYVTAQPQVLVAVNPFFDSNQQWSVGLCDCCYKTSECCYAYWCWSCFMCSLADSINEPSLSWCCIGNSLGVYRMKVRATLKIQGDSCSDCCAVSCCPFCTALQMRYELLNRGLAK